MDDGQKAKIIIYMRTAHLALYAYGGSRLLWSERKRFERMTFPTETYRLDEMS
jgi:hypothetical protein